MSHPNTNTYIVRSAHEISTARFLCGYCSCCSGSVVALAGLDQSKGTPSIATKPYSGAIFRKCMRIRYLFSCLGSRFELCLCTTAAGALRLRPSKLNLSSYEASACDIVSVEGATLLTYLGRA